MFVSSLASLTGFPDASPRETSAHAGGGGRIADVPDMVDVLEFPAEPDGPDVPAILDSQEHAADPDHSHIPDVTDVTDVAADPALTAAPSFY